MTAVKICSVGFDAEYINSTKLNYLPLIFQLDKLSNPNFQPES